jgi:hypothetical protein
MDTNGKMKDLAKRIDDFWNQPVNKDLGLSDKAWNDLNNEVAETSYEAGKKDSGVDREAWRKWKDEQCGKLYDLIRRISK